MLILYIATMFLSAALLFLVQPMVAKMILPLLGGTPAVWNTCMVFFQALLLIGYLYSHFLTTRIRPRYQTLIHCLVILLPAIVLPIQISYDSIDGPPPDANPIPWVLTILALSVGLPFFVVSTTAPLLQKWFAETGHPSGSDPYFLYAASNLGSMLALLGYPAFMEPSYKLADQSWLWTLGYGGLAVFMFFCAGSLWRARRPEVGATSPNAAEFGDKPPPSLGRRLRWIGLAAAPSSLMLGVTTFITTDIASIPLLWVIPLALYLGTFIIAFSRRPWIPHGLTTWLFPVAVMLFPGIYYFKATDLEFMPVHILLFLVTALYCHGELARERPHTNYLTGFYLCMSLGGVLGGIFNAMMAPLVFDRIIEYPIAIVFAALLRPWPKNDDEPALNGWLDVLIPPVVAVVAFGLLHYIENMDDIEYTKIDQLSSGLLFIAAALCVFMVGRPLRFGLAIAALLIASGTDDSNVLHRKRSFFGALKVTGDENAHTLSHGTTNHGEQNFEFDPTEPLTYYHIHSPIGDVFKMFNDRPETGPVALIGLGTGTLASYAQPDQHFTFYEIDPAVVEIARNPEYFTYLSDSKAGKLDIILGDARLRLREAPDAFYHLIVVDAFSSDSIPIHLLTKEALALYLDKLAPGGIIAIHISNRYLYLAPVVGELVRDAGVFALQRNEGSDELTDAEEARGYSHSNWIAVTRKPGDLAWIAADIERWYGLPEDENVGLWTDDFSNILQILNWDLPWLND